MIKKTVLFRSKYHSPITGYGDALTIEKEFKKNKYYKIDLVTSGLPGQTYSGYIAPLKISLDKGYSTAYTNCNAGYYNTPFDSYIPGGGLNPIQPNIFNYFNFYEPNYTTSNSFFAPDDYHFLGVRSVPLGGVVDTAKSLLYKAMIKEYEFVLSPNSLSVSCNSPLQQVFTVTNPDNIPVGSISYVWNLGATPNGWLYNGLPAPATITTTSNSLPLTYSCGQNVPSDILVTVKVNGNTYNTYTSNINFSTAAPGLTISGPNLICTTSPNGFTYTIPNLPCNATVSWSLAWPPGFFNLVPVGNDVILYPLSPINNSTSTLYATVTNGCGISTLVGFPLVFSTGPCACNLITNLSAALTPGSLYTILSWDNIPGTEYYEIQWEYFDCIYGATHSGVAISGGNSYYFYFYNGPPGTKVRFRVRAKCFSFFSGYSNWFDFIVPTPCSTAGGLTATPISGNSVNLTWATVPGGSLYYVYTKYDNGSGFYVTSLSTVTSLNSYDFYNAPAGSTVQFAIKTNCVDGSFSAMSDCVQFIMPVPLTCVTPFGLSYVQHAGSTTLNWNAVPGAATYDIIVDYYPPTGGSGTITGSSTTNSYLFSGAPFGSTCIFRIRANCSNGISSAWSEPYNFTQLRPVVFGNVKETVVKAGINLTVYPVPASKQINILFVGELQGKTDIIILNQFGQIVLNYPIYAFKGHNKYVVDISKFTGGLYILKLKQRNKEYIQKLIIQK